MNSLSFQVKIGRRLYKVCAERDGEGRISLRVFVEKPKKLRGQETAQVFFHVHEWQGFIREAEHRFRRMIEPKGVA